MSDEERWQQLDITPLKTYQKHPERRTTGMSEEERKAWHERQDEKVKSWQDYRDRKASEDDAFIDVISQADNAITEEQERDVENFRRWLENAEPFEITGE